MMTVSKRFVSCILLAAMIGAGGCASREPTQQDAGMIIGGGLGALLGSQVGSGRGQIAAAVIGTMIGAAIGGSVGRTMDEVDRQKANYSFETVRTGVPSSWRNPDTGNQYTVTPTRTFDRSGTPCREYTMDAVVGGKKEQIYGTACRQPNGSWRTSG